MRLRRSQGTCPLSSDPVDKDKVFHFNQYSIKAKVELPNLESRKVVTGRRITSSRDTHIYFKESSDSLHD